MYCYRSNVQQYRKEAIYRRMREAQRDAKRTKDEAVALQGTLVRTQQQVLAVNQFWDAVCMGVDD